MAKYLIEVCDNCAGGVQGEYEYSINCAVCDMGGTQFIPYIGDYLHRLERVAVAEVPQGTTVTTVTSSASSASTYDHNYWDNRAGITADEAIIETQEYWDSRGGSPF